MSGPGVGVSLVSASPAAELLHLFLGDIAAECRRTALRLSVDGSVRHLQADCQLTDAQAPCVLFVTPGAATDERRHLPAVCFAVQLVPSACERWRIFEVRGARAGGSPREGDQSPTLGTVESRRIITVIQGGEQHALFLPAGCDVCWYVLSAAPGCIGEGPDVGAGGEAAVPSATLHRIQGRRVS